MTLGWGLDDDVYFSEPQEITTFKDDVHADDARPVKPVKRVVKKPVEKKIKQESKVGPWGLPGCVRLEDLIGME